MSEESKQLTDEQQLKILEAWNENPKSPPSLKDLTVLAWGGEFDGRSVEGRLIKEFLSTRQLKARAAQTYKPKDKIELTPEHQEFVANNVASMSSVEMARALFNNADITNLCQETRTVNEFVKTLDKKIVFSDPDDVPKDAEYKPPKTLDKMLWRVNKYIHNGIEKDKMTPRQKKELESIIGYLHTYRFLHQINTYDKESSRDLFESSFVRYTYDKSDLTQEEVDQYIVLATEVVISSNIQETIQTIQDQINWEVEGGGKIPMTLVEASNSARNEYNQCVTRQQRLLNDLKIKRSDRMGKAMKENASIINLVAMWKEEETREKMIKLANLRLQSVKNEIDRLSSMDELKVRVLGLSEDETLYG